MRIVLVKPESFWSIVHPANGNAYDGEQKQEMVDWSNCRVEGRQS